MEYQVGDLCPECGQNDLTEDRVSIDQELVLVRAVCPDCGEADSTIVCCVCLQEGVEKNHAH